MYPAGPVRIQVQMTRGLRSPQSRLLAAVVNSQVFTYSVSDELVE